MASSTNSVGLSLTWFLIVTCHFDISLAARTVPVFDISVDSQQTENDITSSLVQESEFENTSSLTQVWNVAFHTTTWKASSYAYVNSKCPNFGRGSNKAPSGCAPGAPPLDVPGRPGVWAWKCATMWIVAIRGTDLGSRGDACKRSDLMADHDLFDIHHIVSGGNIAKDASSGVGDSYFSDVVSYIKRLKPLIKAGTPLLVTGHSLGAGLALYVATTGLVHPSAVFAFAPPPLPQAIVRKIPKGVNVMYNENDPVYHAVRARGGAAGCTFSGDTHAGCPACHKKIYAGYDAPHGAIWPEPDDNCEACWQVAHTLGPYGPGMPGADPRTIPAARCWS